MVQTPDWVDEFDWVKSADGEEAELKYRGILFTFGGPDNTTILRNGEETDRITTPILENRTFTFHKDGREPTKIELEGKRDGDTYRIILTPKDNSIL